MQSIRNAVFGTSSTTDETDATTTGDTPSTTTTTEPTTTTSTTESGSEPLSGETGTGTAEKPYDGGNVEGNSGAPASAPTTTTGTEPSTTTGSEPFTTGTEPSTTTATEPSSTSTDFGDSSTTTKDTPSNPPPSTATAPTSDPLPPSEAPAASNPTPNTASGLGAAPISNTAAPESGANTTPKNQGADAPMDDPAETVADETKASEETGPSGTDTSTAVGSTGGGDIADKAAKGSGPDADDGPSTKEGTGEKWVKTSGVAADGGDFDATKPGAGKEADRLLEEKGIHKEDPGLHKLGEGESASGGASGEKVSMAQKIKDKLHIKSKDKP
ncbi:hypothetical protein MMC25_002651 [Agyrium rufum]|nr:hypothetical protein [Agyrium rufum]